jgi:hypothetical protein
VQAYPEQLILVDRGITNLIEPHLVHIDTDGATLRANFLRCKKNVEAGAAA